MALKTPESCISLDTYSAPNFLISWVRHTAAGDNEDYNIAGLKVNISDQTNTGAACSFAVITASTGERGVAKINAGTTRDGSMIAADLGFAGLAYIEVVRKLKYIQATLPKLR